MIWYLFIYLFDSYPSFIFGNSGVHTYFTFFLFPCFLWTKKKWLVHITQPAFMSKWRCSFPVLAQHLSLVELDHSGSQSSQKYNGKKPELKKCVLCVSVYPVYVCVYYDLPLAELTNSFQLGSCLLVGGNFVKGVFLESL